MSVYEQLLVDESPIELLVIAIAHNLLIFDQSANNAMTARWKYDEADHSSEHSSGKQIGPSQSNNGEDKLESIGVSTFSLFDVIIPKNAPHDNRFLYLNVLQVSKKLINRFFVCSNSINSLYTLVIQLKLPTTSRANSFTSSSAIFLGSTKTHFTFLYFTIISF